MVVRQAEDITLEVEPFHALSPSGSRHALLYPTMFSTFLETARGVGPDRTSVSVCPIGKVLAIDPVGNPTAHDTIRPLAESLRLAVEVKDPMGVSYSTAYEWTIERRLALLTGGSAATTSTVIAWDGAGLNPSLLKALPVVFTLEPMGERFVPASTDFYVFTGADATTGQFSTFVAFQQEFTTDGVTWYSTTSLDPAGAPTGIRVGAPL